MGDDTRNNAQDVDIAVIRNDTQHMRETVDRLAGLMEGKDGVLVRLGKWIGHSKVQWGFISAIIMAIILGRLL